MNIVERIIVYRDRPGRSREGRDLLADAANEIDRLTVAIKKYGCHTYDCEIDRDKPCSCGWSRYRDVLEKPA